LEVLAGDTPEHLLHIARLRLDFRQASLEETWSAGRSADEQGRRLLAMADKRA
jgi:hypothetical protein